MHGSYDCVDLTKAPGRKAAQMNFQSEAHSVSGSTFTTNTYLVTKGSHEDFMENPFVCRSFHDSEITITYSPRGGWEQLIDTRKRPIYAAILLKTFVELDALLCVLSHFVLASIYCHNGLLLGLWLLK